jgi:hypothetical protein
MLTKPRKIDASKFEHMNTDSDCASFIYVFIDVLITVYKSLLHKQLFATKQGRLRFSLKGVLPGDQLCIFDGAPTAHTIRKAGDANQEAPETWRFHGPAFVYGMMNGEIRGMGLKSRDFVMV